VQFADGYTLRDNSFITNCLIRKRHRNGLLNVAFLDGGSSGSGGCGQCRV